MTKDLSREDRLAAQLRANLKRRKAQKKAIALEAAPPPSGGEGDSAGLSKTADEG